jgi:cell filamentation protein
VYPWAGRLRTVRIANGGSMFCYPEHIPVEMRCVFGWGGTPRRSPPARRIF